MYLSYLTIYRFGNFVSYGRRKWVNYFLFRTLPVAVIVLLEVSIEQRYFKVDQPWFYAFLSAIVSLLFRDTWGYLKRESLLARD